MAKVSYIVFEGPPCAGKTTHSKMMAKKLSSEGHPSVYLKSSPSYRIFGKTIIELRKYDLPEKLNDILYAADLIMDDMRIKDKISEGISVVQDKWVPSIQAYCEIFHNHDSSFKKYFSHFTGNDLSVPDMIIFLSPDSETIKNRLKNRKCITPIDQNMLDDMVSTMNMSKLLEDIVDDCKNVIYYNNSKTSVADTNKFLMDVVNSKYGW